MNILFFIWFLTCISFSSSMALRKLPYFGYLTPEEYELEVAMAMDKNDNSRTEPKHKLNPYNSPIYYIRLPPQPYMFVPGLGYISQPPPPPPPMSSFVNLPVNFVANGKPSTIYQWAAGMEDFPENNVENKPQQPQKIPTKPSKGDSTIHKLEGQFVFNGKPDSMFVLRDSYNSLYGDALQNFYP